MEDKKPRSILLILGWVIAGLVLILYLGSKYDISVRKKPPTSKKVTVSEESRESTSVTGRKARLDVSATKPARSQPAELSTEELFQTASPSVVLIEVFDDEGHKRGLGSGFVASEDGAIVTNYHVIRGAHRAVAHFNDGGSAPIKGVSGYDLGRDVAVLHAAGAVPRSLTLGNSDAVKVGQRIVAVGSPLGFQNTISEGIVSGIRLGLIQMSTPISPGSSGGPLLNTRGEIVGVAVASVVQGQNLNFAVPVNWAKAYIGTGSVRSLAEIAGENTVVERVLDGTVSIPGGQSQSWEIRVDSNLMSNPELHGSFQSEGGLTGKIRVLLLQGQNILYDSGRVTRDDFHWDLSIDGSYTLVLDNRDSLMFARRVRGTILLRYVK